MRARAGHVCVCSFSWRVQPKGEVSRGACSVPAPCSSGSALHRAGKPLLTFRFTPGFSPRPCLPSVIWPDPSVTPPQPTHMSRHPPHLGLTIKKPSVRWASFFGSCCNSQSSKNTGGRQGTEYLCASLYVILSFNAHKNPT